MKLLSKLQGMLNEVKQGFNEGYAIANHEKWKKSLINFMDDRGIQHYNIHYSLIPLDVVTDARLAVLPDSIHVEYNYDQPLFYQIVQIAHELGHYSQFIDECFGSRTEWMLYNEINHQLDIEADAWYRAVHLLKSIGFNQWGKFRSVSARYYGSYIMAHYGHVQETAQIHMNHYLTTLDKEIKREVIYA